MNDDDFDDYVPSVLNPRSVKKSSGDFNLTQNSVRSRCSLSLKRSILSNLKKNSNKFLKENKENLGRVCNIEPKHKHLNEKRLEDEETLRFSAIEDLNSMKDDCLNSPTLLLPDFPLLKSKDNSSLKSLSSATELSYNDSISSDTVIYNYKIDEKPAYIVSFSVKNSEYVNLSTKNSNIKNISISNVKCDMNIECEVIEHSDSSQEMAAEVDSIKSYGPCPSKRLGVSVNLEIKKQKLLETVIEEENKILILNTSDTKKLSDVIVQPINYKLLKQKINERSKFIASKRKYFFKSYRLRNGKTVDNLKQQSIDSYFANILKTQKASNDKILGDVIKDGVCLTNKDSAQDALHDMSRNLCITATRHDVAAQPTKATKRNDYCTSQRKVSHRSISPRMEIKESDFSHTKTTNESVGSYSPRKTVDTIQFNLPVKSRSNKTSTVTKVIPHYKIVAGTHFAVDAFSYGEIANVKHYFLTHFHSDHYSGLRKSFNKMLFCSKITADLCISRLGVGVKYIHILNVDESIKIDGVEVTAIDANHCPGAIMLVFTLPNGKTLLHTGDFRASPIMESYPVFWNRDIHTVYLDTTYCNPRYDFPTQDESLEMALFHLRQKKSALEKAGKKFASVLIVCGTYTIGKEKFFLGMARRVGCSVWACPEKDRVLQAVEGRSFSHAPPHSCQLHVVPMRDLTHEISTDEHEVHLMVGDISATEHPLCRTTSYYKHSKLRCYLDSLQGAFSEVVAFKPSGWENGKNSCTEKDSVTIHGIPYSEHSSFSEMIRFVKYLKPKQVVPTVDISGGIKAVQKFFPCPLVYKEEFQNQAKVTDYFRIQNKHQPAVT